MGVHGLWTLLQPVARPVTLETLKDKRLAIDASMWLYQFQMATRDRKTGDVIYGAHIMGTFRRIMKLLFYGVKPVFVFDGDAPTLKKRTIEQRKRRKTGAGRDLAKTAHELLAAQLRSAAAEREIARRKERIAAADAGAEKSGEEDDAAADQPAAGKKPVYLEDLNKSVSPIKPRRDVLRDDYALPRIEGTLESRAKPSDPRIATEEELRDFLDELRPEDLDLNSKFFGDLPTEVKYEIIGDLRLKTRQVNHRRVQQMRGSAAIDFSKAQIEHLMERNSYTQKLLSITDELGKSAIAIPSRVAGQRNREYLLIKQDASKGGGWVLGVKNPEISNTDPIVIETTTDESVGERTDTDEFEEVGFDSPEKPTVGLPTPDVEARRALAEEAIYARFAAKSAPSSLDPYLDQPSDVQGGASNLFQGEPDEADPALQAALFESAQPPAAQTGRNSTSGSKSARTQASQLGRNSTSSDPILVQVPAVPQAPSAAEPPSLAQADDSEDDLEYVDVTSAPQSGPAPTSQPAVAEPQADTEESDEFEEVAPAAATPAPPPPLDRPLPRPRPAPQPAPAPAPSLPPAAVPSRSLFDSILPSDSDSEADEYPRRKPREHVHRPLQEPVAPPPLSPSPDPFERFEQERAPALEQRPARMPDAAETAEAPRQPVQAMDFALDDAPSIAEPNPEPDRLANGDAALPDVDRLPLASARQEDGPRRSSPVQLPTAVPPSEKALDAIGTSEMAVLPDVLASMPSPDLAEVSAAPDRAPSTLSAAEEPAVRYYEDLEPRQKHVGPGPSATSAPAESEPPATAPKHSEPQEVVQYLEDLENPVPGRPAPRAKVGAADADEEFLSDWSRSPSPESRARGKESRDAFMGVAAQAEDDDPEAEEAALEMMREEEAYADVMAQLRNGSVESMRLEAEKEVARLSAQKRAEMRNADGVTRQMAIDIREMLVLFGIPFVDAPSEAEAECASLLQRKLVDGIVTDDSDVFLFGGSRIYRNMFNEAKYVECYLLSDLEREIGLDRSKLVRLAYLLGSDYTEGLPGVGVVAGRELLEEFPGDDGLRDFRAWWDKVQKGIDTPADTDTTWKKRFKSGHRQLVLDQGWPSAEVRQAYFRPVVDETDDPFTWGTFDLDGLRLYLHRSLGWGQAKCDSILLPLIKREQERKEGRLKSQAMVTDFFDYSAGDRHFMRKKQRKYASKRLQNVVQAWKGRSQSPKEPSKIEEMAEEEAAEAEADAAPEAQPPKKRKRASKSTAKSAARKKTSSTARSKRNGKSRLDENADDQQDPVGEDQPAERVLAADAPGPSRVQPARKKRKAPVVVEPLSGDESDQDE